MWSYFRHCTFYEKILLLAFGLMMVESSMKGISYFTLAFCVIALPLIPRFKSFDSIGKWLLCFSIFYSGMIVLNNLDVEHIPKYMLAPLVFYAFGKYLICSLRDDSLILSFMAIMFVLFAGYTYYACVLDFQAVGLINPFRTMYRIGTDDSNMPATLYGLNVSLGLVGLPLFMNINKADRKSIHWLFVVAFALSLFTVIHLVNRTGLVVAACVFLASIYYKLGAKNKQAFLAILEVSIIFLISYKFFQSSEIGTAYMSREELEDGHNFSDAGDRTWRWADAIVRLFVDPFGWPNNQQYIYVHNLWLDIAKVTGTIPFLCLLIATIYSIKDILFLFKYKRNSIVALLVGLYVAFFLESFVEPVIAGYDLFFYMFCMLWGMSKQYKENILL